MSITTLDREFNHVIFIYDFFLNEIILFHVMNTVSRYLAASVVQSTGLSEALCAFETIWIAQFWTPKAVHADCVFHTGEFKEMLQSQGISLRPVPPRRHKKYDRATSWSNTVNILASSINKCKYFASSVCCSSRSYFERFIWKPCHLGF